MTTTQTTQDLNKDIIRGMFEAFAKSDGEALREPLSPDFTAHTMPPGFAGDAEGFEQLMHATHAGLSDCGNVVEGLVAEEDSVVAHYTAQGRFTGELFGMPPTGELVTMSGIEWYRLRAGQVTDYWSYSTIDFGMSTS